ncbi:MAG: DUF2029 domain-containing protein [Novosphingobium sp.]|nr:DUF2029 domain-containing protein [Novosphingobium sp.]
MKRNRPWSAALGALPEPLLLMAILTGGLVTLRGFLAHGYLPQPFIWDPQDTFMDWFNPAWWAHHEGAYSVWRAVYPPLSFALLKYLSIDRCYVTSPFAARDCDYVSIAAILISYAVAIGLTWLSLRRVQPSRAGVRTVAIAFGYPGLFTLERGNLLILCYIALVVAFGSIAKGRLPRALAAGMMINFKPYMVVPTMALAITRNWRMLEFACLATIATYLMSWAIVGGGSVLEIASNTANWVVMTGMDPLVEVYYSTSFNNLFGLVDRGLPILRFVPSRGYDNFLLVATLSMRIAIGLGLAALAAAWLQPRAVPETRLVLILLLISLISRSPGGYTELFVVYLVFLEPWHRAGPIIAIAAAYLINIPADIVLSYLPNVKTWSWLTQHAVTGQFGIAVGQFARPFGLMLILAVLALDTIWQSVQAHRSHAPTLGLAHPVQVAT